MSVIINAGFDKQLKNSVLTKVSVDLWMTVWMQATYIILIKALNL